MARRGPDDEGIWTDEQHCTLGFRRLSILDLSPTGHQPMLTPDGRFAMVLNGEVYNFRELRTRLEQQGVAFRSSGDTEVVLQALALWGRAALQQFNGMFALAFYDTLEKRLLLARDFAGIKPLYYLLNPHGLLFASQYDQILAHPWSQLEPVAPDALGLYLRLGYIPAPYALKKNTYMLEPGTWLEISADGRCQQGRFYEFPVYQAPDLRGEEAFEAVDAAITNAVRRQMVSDVPLGTFLSGGIDSPLVAAKMQAIQGSGIKAFTMGTTDTLDESSDAAFYAKALNLDHTIYRVSHQDALNLVDDVVAACGEPFADYSIFPTLLISRLAHQQVTVMLSGDGGDELFWGYSGRFGSVLKKSPDFALAYYPRFLLGGLRKVFGSQEKLFHINLKSVGDWYRHKHTRIFEDRLKRLFPSLPDWPEAYNLFNYSGWELDQTAQWMRWNEFVGHLTMVLMKVDRASMYNSLEVRVPLLDKEVIETALRVDWQSCLNIKTNLGKIPLRKSLEKHVKFQTQSKRGFSVPMDDWLRGPLRDRVEAELMTRKDLLDLPIDRTMLRRFVDQQRQGALDGWGVWLLLSLGMWENRYLKLETP